MSQAYQQKLDRYAARYPDGGVPMDARHVLELCSDLHDLLSVAVGRIAQLEEQVRQSVPPPPYQEPRG
jgi:hypothetical protein